MVQILTRIEEIATNQPAHVVLECGINDLQAGKPMDGLTNRYAEIANRFLNCSPRTEVLMLQLFPVNHALYEQCIVPVHPSIHEPTPIRVEPFNEWASRLADGNPRLTFVRVPIVDSDGQLSAQFTLDGLHPNGAGLKKIAQAILQH